MLGEAEPDQWISSLLSFDLEVRVFSFPVEGLGITTMLHTQKLKKGFFNTCLLQLNKEQWIQVSKHCLG